MRFFRFSYGFSPSGMVLLSVEILWKSVFGNRIPHLGHREPVLSPSNCYSQEVLL